jgi:hypothetical protein
MVDRTATTRRSSPTPHALRRGLRDYPFGEKWLFDAFARSHLPVLDVAERHDDHAEPADQLRPGAGKNARFLRRHRVDAADRDVADAGRARRPPRPG